MKIEKADVLARKIKRITGVNVFENTRRRDAIEARSLFNWYLYNQYGFSLCEIARYYRNNKKAYDHSTAIHSLKNYEVYIRFSPHLKQWANEVQFEHMNNKLPYLMHMVRNFTPESAEAVFPFVEAIYETQIREQEEIV